MSETKELSEVKGEIRTQLALNVGHYAAVYAECLKQAKMIVGERASDAETHEVATTLFDRFCQDQLEQAKETKKNQQLMGALKPLLAALERRGLYM